MYFPMTVRLTLSISRHIEHDGHNLCSTCNLVPVVASAEEKERMEKHLTFSSRLAIGLSYTFARPGESSVRMLLHRGPGYRFRRKWNSMAPSKHEGTLLELNIWRIAAIFGRLSRKKFIVLLPHRIQSSGNIHPPETFLVRRHRLRSPCFSAFLGCHRGKYLAVIFKTRDTGRSGVVTPHPAPKRNTRVTRSLHVTSGERCLLRRMAAFFSRGCWFVGSRGSVLCLHWGS